jgi:acetylornithine/N-succinyldiaminopimelate aminotransferase
MLGLQCKVESRALLAALRSHGLLTVTAEGNALRLLPPLIIAERHVDEAIGLIEKASAELKG